MSIQSLYNDINLLNSSKVRFLNIVTYLNSSISKLSFAGEKVSSICSIDDTPTPIVSRCQKLCNEMINTLNYITGTILPAIDQSIIRKNNEIILEQARMRR